MRVNLSLSVLLASVALAACSKSQSPTSSSPMPSTTTTAPSSTSGTPAASVSFQGRVQSVDTANMRLTLDNGTIVAVNATTSLMQNNAPTTFAALASAFAAGTTINVQGQGTSQADGSVLAGAVSIQMSSNASSPFGGQVASVNSAKLSITLADKTVLVVNAQTAFDPYGNLTSFTAIANAITAGKKVKIDGKGTPQADGSILATSIKAQTDNDPNTTTYTFSGQVVSVNSAKLTITLDDKTILVVNGQTAFDPYGNLRSFTAIANAYAAGRAVQIDGKGTRQADGSILVTSLKAQSATGTAAYYSFSGQVVYVNSAKYAVTLDDKTIVVVNAQTTFDPYGNLTSFTQIANAYAAGKKVTVTGQGTTQADGSILATSIKAQSDNGPVTYYSFNGQVVYVNSAKYAITLDDKTIVVVNAQTTFDPYGDYTSFNAIASAYAAGKKVNVSGKGTTQADGSILATQIKADAYDDYYAYYEFDGRVASVNANRMTLTLDDQTVVAVNAQTVFDKNGDYTSFTAVANAFAAGKKIDVVGEGTKQADGSILAKTIKATLYEADDDDDDGDDDDDDDDGDTAYQKFEDRVVSVNAAKMSLALKDGTVVVVNAQTEFDEDGDLLSFTAIANKVAAGKKVEVKGKGTRQADGSILAKEIEAEVDDD